MRTIACIATGPSLTKADVDFVREYADEVIAVNNAYEIAPWADILYACDYEFWDLHFPKMKDLPGEKITINKKAADVFGIKHLNFKTDCAFSRDPAYIATGGNSGFQAVNIAALRNCDRIVLLGFDMGKAPDGKKHFFGDHPDKLNRASNYTLWINAFEKAAPIIRPEVINCTRTTALRCFPRDTLENVFRKEIELKCKQAS